MRFYFLGKVAETKINIYDKKRFHNYMAKMNGKEIQLSVGPKMKPRSLNENAYYWAVVVQTLADEFGYLPEEMHSILKSLFLKKETLLKKKKYMTVASTALLSTIEFEDYCEKIRKWALVDHGVKIPLPNEIDTEEYENFIKNNLVTS